MELTPAGRSKLNDLLLIQFQQLYLGFDQAVLLSYVPLESKGEINTFPMSDYLLFRMPGLRVAYPVADLGAGHITAMLVNEDTAFVPGAYGIAEPEQGKVVAPELIDLVFVPLLAMDRNGFRVGYGKGFYDRFLARCRPGVEMIGFSYFEPVDHIEDISHFDVPLTTGITPGAIYEF